MDIRALLFDVNGTLIDIETDEGLEEIYRAIGHFLMYQGISLHRWEVRDLYFQIMQQQRAQSAETFAEFDLAGVLPASGSVPILRCKRHSTSCAHTTTWQ